MIEVAHGAMKFPEYRAGFVRLPCRSQRIMAEAINPTEQSPNAFLMFNPQTTVVGGDQPAGQHALVLKMPRDGLDILINSRGKHGIDPLQDKALFITILDKPCLVDQAIAQR